MLKKLFLLCAVLFTAATAMAQVETITINFTPGAGGEASIKYMGINGNEELNKLVPIFIKASGSNRYPAAQILICAVWPIQLHANI